MVSSKWTESHRFTFQIQPPPELPERELELRLENLNTELGPLFAHIAITGGQMRRYLCENGHYTVVGTEPKSAILIQGAILRAKFTMESRVAVKPTESHEGHRLDGAFSLISAFVN